MLIAVGIPVLTTCFWLAVLYALFHPHTDMRWFVSDFAGALVIVFLGTFRGWDAGRLAPVHEGTATRIPVADPPCDSKRG